MDRVRRAEVARRRARLPGPAAEGTRSRARLRPRPARVPGSVQVHPRRRVPGHRSAAGGNSLAARGTEARRRQAPGSGSGAQARPGLRPDDRPGARSREPGARLAPIPIRRGALFVVGDPKQSIYRFRRADVGIYQEVCDLLVERHGARRVHLRTNFRSVPTIQHAVNAAFAPGDAARRMCRCRPTTLRWRRTERSCAWAAAQSSAADAQTAGSRLQAPGSGPRLAPRPGAGAWPAAWRAAARRHRAARPRSLRDAERRHGGRSRRRFLTPSARGCDWLVRESGWTVTERREGSVGRGAGRAAARLHSVPPLREVAATT